MLAVTSSRAAYAAWWEAYELADAELTEAVARPAGRAGGHAGSATVRHVSDTDRDPDEGHCDERDTP